jgi:hypothetical protein
MGGFMKLIYLMFLFSFSAFSQNVEVSATGSSFRVLSQPGDCGGWGHMLLRKEAQDKATVLANTRCWGAAELISEFEYQTECTVHPFSGADIEIVTAKATFQCLPSDSNNTPVRYQCLEPLRQCGSSCCWPHY